MKKTLYIIAGLTSGTLIVLLTSLFPEYFSTIPEIGFNSNTSTSDVNVWVGLIFFLSLLLIAKHKFNNILISLIGFIFAYNLSVYLFIFGLSIISDSYSDFIPLFISTLLAGIAGGLVVALASGTTIGKMCMYGAIFAIPLFFLSLSLYLTSDNEQTGQILISLIHPIWQTGMAWAIYSLTLKQGKEV